MAGDEATSELLLSSLIIDWDDDEELMIELFYDKAEL